MTNKHYFVYMLAQKPRGVLYIGVTNHLIRRIWEHKQGIADSFTRTYHVKNLVWYEAHIDIQQAIQREKQLKNWQRK